MSKRQVDRSLAVLKRVTNPELERIEKDFNLQDKGDVLGRLNRQDAGEVAKNIAAAVEMLMLAGETNSAIQARFEQLESISKERRQILYDRASTLTLLANIEYFFNDVNECRKFIDTLSNEAKDNLFQVLLEVTSE